jgi:hypothetical protein
MYIMTQRKTAAGKTLKVVLGFVHCVGNVLDGVVNQNTHKNG